MAWPLAAEEIKTVRPGEARAMMGQEVSLAMYVRSTGYNRSNGGYTELYSQVSWDHPENFFVRVTPAARKQFAKLGIYDTMEHLGSRSIQVTGRVEELTIGQLRFPVIYVQSLDQLQVSLPEEYLVAPDTYEKITTGEFELRLSPLIAKSPETRQRLIEYFRAESAKIQTVVPEASFAGLRHAVFWVNANGLKPGAAYHPNPEYLKRAGVPTAYAHCVEIQQAGDFLKRTIPTQPWVVLHELAHKFHFEVLGEKRGDIRDAYAAAKASGAYLKVKHANGKEGPAYALANDKEYFAELTEAYFGKNDFYPFTKEELRKHDPQGFAMIEACWGVGTHRNKP